MQKKWSGPRTAWAAACLLASLAAHATEGGQTTAAAGAEGFLAGALPPPGFYGLLYVNHYRASRFNGGDGERAIPGFEVRATALVARGLYMSDAQVLGGQLGAYAVVPFAKVSLDAAGASGHHSGLGDIELAPLVAWHFSPQWHAAVAPAVVLPTGDYDAKRLVNTGNHYATFRPVAVLSYLGDSGVDASVKLTYSINRRNRDTDYRSGNYLHADYNLGWRLNDAWQVGAQGYWIHQVQDDTQDGVKVGDDGFRTRVWALGPALRWQSPTGPSVEVRYQKEFRARYRSEGDALWLKAVWKL